jgi:hypothetical protein
MAGEESTVGGVTVQQYLAEVERTTDPTLTSTYEKLFKEAAKYRKTRFIIYSFFGEDVMTAINPLSKILQDNLKLILTVLQHLLHYLKIRSKN